MSAMIAVKTVSGHLMAAAKFGWGQQPNRAEPEAPYGISYPGIGHLHLIKQPTKALSVLWQKQRRA